MTTTAVPKCRLSSAGFRLRGIFFYPHFAGDRMSTLLMNGEDMNRAITRIAHEILEKNKGTRVLASKNRLMMVRPRRSVLF